MIAVWRHWEGHRVRMGGDLFRVNRWGDVERRSRLFCRRHPFWFKATPRHALEVKKAIMKHVGMVPAGWVIRAES